ncbi:MAG: hypothetical protein AB4044_02305, partial [Crocosphaera sp.]
IAKEAKKGSLKLWKSKKGIWYVLLSVSMEVPDAESVKNWIGVDPKDPLSWDLGGFDPGIPRIISMLAENQI